MQQLCLVHVAAQSMCHAVVAQGAHSAVEAEGVRVEPLQVQALRQLQDVHASAVEMGHIQGLSRQRRWETEKQTTERQRGAQVSVGGPSSESQCSAGSRFCEVCGAESRSLLMVLEVPQWSGGSLTYIWDLWDGLVLWGSKSPWEISGDPEMYLGSQVGSEYPSGRSEYPGYI